VTIQELKEAIDPPINEVDLKHKGKWLLFTPCFTFRYGVLLSDEGETEHGADTFDEFIALPIKEWGEKSISDIIGDLEFGYV
jgi:hypothetical protein